LSLLQAAGNTDARAKRAMRMNGRNLLTALGSDSTPVDPYSQKALMLLGIGESSANGCAALGAGLGFLGKWATAFRAHG